MKADLILVSHNSKQDLERFLPSILASNGDFSITIVDNGSSAETLAYLQNCGQVVIFQSNKGYAAGCNAGAKNGNAEFIVFLNCDLLAGGNWLEKLLAPFADETVAVTGARLFSPDGLEYPTPEKDMAIGCCFAVRRSIFRELGGFDENFFLFFEETDFCRRAVASYYKVVRSEAQLVHFHPHFPHFTGKLQEYWENSKAYFEKKHGLVQKKLDIALVMIVKDEELGLERAILSCRDFVREIVIAIDNKSTDKTEEIAWKYATTLKHFDFEDDFSKARNFAHQGVKTKWILFLDGHEYVAKSPDLAKHLQSASDGLMCPIEMDNGMIFGNPRIYRNGVQFEGRIHERQMCKSVEPYHEFLIKHARVGGQSDAAIAEREAQRDVQVQGIMGREYKKNSRDIRASFHLALHTQSRGRARAAIRWWKRYLKYSRIRGERWYAFFNISLCHLTHGNLFRAFWYAGRADDVTPGRWEVFKLKGLILFQRRKFAGAAECFVNSFKVNTGVVDYLPWPRDDSGTYNLIGECLFNLGVYDRAAMAFDRAAEDCKDEKFKAMLKKRAALMVEIAKSAALGSKN